MVLGDERSLLQDAAEEMTFQHGESGEKTLARRTIRDAAKQNEGAAPKRVMQILMRFRHAESFDLRHQVREQFPEPAHQANLA